MRLAFDLYDILVFPDQPLTPDDEIRTIKILHPDIADADNGWGLNLPGYDKILLLSNVVEEGQPIGFHNKIGMGWHIDGVGWEPPPLVSSLFAVEVPPTGSCTWFASTILAYDLLPTATKERIEHMAASYDFIGSQRWLAANSEGYMAPIPDSEIPNYPPIPTPLVLTHPRTGRKSLFFCNSNIVDVWDGEGKLMPYDEGCAVLQELETAVIGNPHNRFAVPWQNNQLVIWNNRTTFHSRPVRLRRPPSRLPPDDGTWSRHSPSARLGARRYHPPLIEPGTELVTTVETERFRIRPMTVHDTIRDYEAVAGSPAELGAAFGDPNSVPMPYTMEQEIIELGWHQKEFQMGFSFTFIVVPLDEHTSFGNVYVFPATRGDFDAEVYTWVRKDQPHEGLGDELFATARGVDRTRLAVRTCRLSRPRHRLARLGGDAAHRRDAVVIAADRDGTVVTCDDGTVLRFVALGGAFGARVTGIDLTQELHPSVVATLQQAFLVWHFLCIPGQDLAPADEIRTITYFDDGVFSLDDLDAEQFAVPGYPQIQIVSNIEVDGKAIGYANRRGLGMALGPQRDAGDAEGVVDVRDRSAGVRW